MINRKDITGIILAGGKSTRMGSDKGLILLNEHPFIHHIIKAIRPLVSELIIVSDNPDYDLFNLKRVNDLFENSGPLAGVYTGLTYSETKYNLVLSCDVPLITSETLKKLIEAFDDTTDIIQFKSKDKTMPLIALYNISCKDVFLSLLMKGERRLMDAVNYCKVKTIELDKDFEKFTVNINSIDDLKEIGI